MSEISILSSSHRFGESNLDLTGIMQISLLMIAWHNVLTRKSSHYAVEADRRTRTYAGKNATKIPMKNLMVMSKGTVFANPNAIVPIEASKTPEIAVDLRPIVSDR